MMNVACIIFQVETTFRLYLWVAVTQSFRGESAMCLQTIDVFPNLFALFYDCLRLVKIHMGDMGMPEHGSYPKIAFNREHIWETHEKNMSLGYTNFQTIPYFALFQ